MGMLPLTVVPIWSVLRCSRNYVGSRAYRARGATAVAVAVVAALPWKCQVLQCSLDDGVYGP